ncbi:MAG TPA: hypothetical protein VF582_07750 [Allosphingosinicella sp.]
MGHFADSHAERLIVFVHGFAGTATRTWRGMEALLAEPGVQAADVIFYGYGSLAAPARNSAALFLEMLTACAEQQRPWQHALFRAGAPGTRNYSDILIIAHSLGAVVARRALLDAIADHRPWVGDSRLLLFGPAHMGTRLIELKKMLRSGVGSILADLFTFASLKMPVLDDLDRGSPFLRDLAHESEAALAAGLTQPVRAEGVVFGERENVVVTDPFCQDPRATVWQGEDHCSVCRVPRTIAEVARHL